MKIERVAPMLTGRVAKTRLFLKGLHFTLIFSYGLHIADYLKFDRVDSYLLIFCLSCSCADFFVEVPSSRPKWVVFLKADL